MIAFAVGELRLRLFDFLQMSYYEFKLMSFGYHRERNHREEVDMVMTRKVVMASYWCFNGNYKNFPKSELEVFKTSFDKLPENVDDLLPKGMLEEFYRQLEEYNIITNQVKNN